MSLLHALPVPVQSGAVGGIFTVPVSNEMQPPWLVSGSKDVLWISRAKPSDAKTLLLRCALRPSKDFEFQALSALLEKSASLGCRYSTLQEAQEHLAYYDIEAEEYPSPIPGIGILVPKERSLLGVVYDAGGMLAAVIHNPARAIAFYDVGQLDLI